MLKRVTNNDPCEYTGIFGGEMYVFGPLETKVLEGAAADHLVVQSLQGNRRVLTAADADDLNPPPKGEVAEPKLGDLCEAGKPTTMCPYPGCSKELVEGSIGYRRHIDMHVRLAKREALVVQPKPIVEPDQAG